MTVTAISDKTQDLINAARLLQINFQTNPTGVGLSPDFPTCLRFALEVARAGSPIQIVQVTPPGIPSSNAVPTGGS